MKVIDETDNKHNKLTVIKRHGSHRCGGATWLCRCDCGIESIVLGHHLRSGKVKSCGCTWGGYEVGESAFNKLFYVFKLSAKKRNHSWNLSKEHVKKITKMNCSYCGSKPKTIAKGKNGDYIYNGIDRVDNNLGYEIDNVVPCCKKCNLAKHIMSTEEFFDWIKTVHDRCKFFLGR